MMTMNLNEQIFVVHEGDNIVIGPPTHGVGGQ